MEEQRTPPRKPANRRQRQPADADEFVIDWLDYPDEQLRLVAIEVARELKRICREGRPDAS